MTITGQGTYVLSGSLTDGQVVIDAVLGVGALAGCGAADTASTTSAVTVSATQTAAEVLAADKEAHSVDGTSDDDSTATTITLAVVHHGGAGTTAAGLRAGRPTLICPVLGDQGFWAERVSHLGAGPRPTTWWSTTARSPPRPVATSSRPTDDEADRRSSGRRW